MSRSGKLIPNGYVREQLNDPILEGLDGELVVGSPNAPNTMQMTTSGVMSRDGMPRFEYHVFDYYTQPDVHYEQRYNHLMSWATKLRLNRHVLIVVQHKLNTQRELDEYERHYTENGYEGVMIRSPQGKYKFGRSTAKEQYLLKVKRWFDGEAIIADFKEFMHNANELQTDELGYAKRTSHSDGKVPMGKLGSLECVDMITGQEVSIGTGFDMSMRQHIWDNRPSYVGRIVKYKHFAVTGVKDAPRFPTFLGFRDPIDM